MSIPTIDEARKLVGTTWNSDGAIVTVRDFWPDRRVHQVEVTTPKGGILDKWMGNAELSRWLRDARQVHPPEKPESASVPE